MPQAVFAAAQAVGAFAVAHPQLTKALVSIANVLIGSAIVAKVTRHFMPSTPESTIDTAAILETTTGGIQTGNIIYGTARVAGHQVAPWMVSDRILNDNERLWIILVFACHEIDGYEKIYINETELDAATDFNLLGDCTDAAFQSGHTIPIPLLNVQFYDGTQTTADAGWNGAFTEVTSDFVLEGLAYCVVRLTRDTSTTPNDVWNAGVPRQITCRIRGKEVYDPRTATTAFSANPALCFRDFVTDTAFGLAEPATFVDDDAIEVAADICDDTETVRDNAGGSTTQTKWVCDGLLSSGALPYNNLEQILSSMGGSAAFVGSGEWRCWAAAWLAPVGSIDETYLAGPLRSPNMQAPSESRYNSVSGSYIGADRGDIPTAFPARSDAGYATDDGATIDRDIQLRMTNDTQRAQRLATLSLKQSRNWTILEWPGNLRCFQFELNDVVNVSVAELGYVDEPFRIIGWQYNDEGVRMTLKTESQSSYAIALSDLLDDPAPVVV